MEITRSHLINLINIALNAKAQDYDADAPVGKAVLAVSLFIDNLTHLHETLKDSAAVYLLDAIASDDLVHLDTVKYDLQQIKATLEHG